MRILILGGTVFLSAELARQAVARGHDVSCLARGSSGAVPEGARFIQADREHRMQAVQESGHAGSDISTGPDPATGAGAYAGAGGDWDAVVEVSWQPRHVRDALAALAGRTAHWTYVSSCSVYAGHDLPGTDETAPVLPAYDGADPATRKHYGEAKVACERAAAEAVGHRLHICRPGLIGGAADPSDRFGYWPARLARSDAPVLVPDIPQAMTQTIDVRDLAAWILSAAETHTTGIYNAVGRQTSFADLLEYCRRESGFAGDLVWADPVWLAERNVAYWAGPDSLPHWLPEGYEGFAGRSNEAAVEHGMRPRPIDETVIDVLRDERLRGLERERKAGLSPATEARLLAELHAPDPR